MCQHGVYTVNEATRTIHSEMFEGDVLFSFVDDQMTITDTSDESGLSLTFHRPSQADVALLEDLEKKSPQK